MTRPLALCAALFAAGAAPPSPEAPEAPPADRDARVMGHPGVRRVAGRGTLRAVGAGDTHEGAPRGLTAGEGRGCVRAPVRGGFL